MVLKTKCLVFVLACMAWLVLAGSSQAQMQGGGLGFGGYGYGGWWTGIPYGFAQSQDQLPYFSKYPPVYYSRPVARPYGYSPFAYPPGFVTPDIQQMPTEVINPYVPQQEAKPTSDRTATGRQSPVPKVVVNPFVDQAQLSFDQ
jgi:hypothetical protein